MKLSRIAILWAVTVVALFTSACGNPSPSSPTDTTPTPPAATVTVTANPDTVTASASADPAYTWSGSFVATISNTNTSPLTIRSIAADLQQSTGGIVIVPIEGTDELYRFDVRAPGNRIDLSGTLDIPFTFYYTLPNGGREAIITVAFAVTTDAGGTGTVTTTVNLQ